jgi:hypothetical protein
MLLKRVNHVARMHVATDWQHAVAEQRLLPAPARAPLSA